MHFIDDCSSYHSIASASSEEFTVNIVHYMWTTDQNQLMEHC